MALATRADGRATPGSCTRRRSRRVNNGRRIGAFAPQRARLTVLSNDAGIGPGMKTATVALPISLAARRTWIAISPRFATRIFSNSLTGPSLSPPIRTRVTIHPRSRFDRARRTPGEADVPGARLGAAVSRIRDRRRGTVKLAGYGGR